MKLIHESDASYATLNHSRYTNSTLRKTNRDIHMTILTAIFQVFMVVPKSQGYTRKSV